MGDTWKEPLSTIEDIRIKSEILDIIMANVRGLVIGSPELQHALNKLEVDLSEAYNSLIPDGKMFDLKIINNALNISWK